MSAIIAFHQPKTRINGGCQKNTEVIHFQAFLLAFSILMLDCRTQSARVPRVYLGKVPFLSFKESELRQFGPENEHGAALTIEWDELTWTIALVPRATWWLTVGHPDCSGQFLGGWSEGGQYAVSYDCKQENSKCALSLVPRWIT